MANAKERNDKQRRINLLERLGECDRDKLKEYVKAEGLPGATKDWTLDQISAAVTALHPIPKLAADAAGKTVTGKPKNAPAAEHFSIQYGEDHAPKVYSFKTREAADTSTNKVGENQTGHSASKPEDLASVPMDVLLAIVNQTKETPVTKFANKQLAQESAFQSLSRVAEAGAPKKANKPKIPAAPRTPRPVNYEPKAKGDIKTVRVGSKIATIIDLLSRKEGTTLAEIEAEGSKSGKPISARAWLGYDLNKVTGYGVRQEGDRLFLVLPKGMTEPVPHKVATPAVKKGGAVKADAKGKKGAAPAEAEVVVAEEKPAIKRRPGGKKA